MKPELTPEDLLLYWSGELPEEQRAELQTRIADDPSAQAYLRELDELNEDVTALPPQATNRDWSELVEQEADILELPDRKPAKVIPLWQRRSTLLMAASLAVVLSLGWLLQRQLGNSSPETPAMPSTEVAESTPTLKSLSDEPREVNPQLAVAEEPVETEAQLTDFNEPRAPRKLSDRLFQSSARLSSRDRLESWRERRAGLLNRSSFIQESSS